MIDSKSGWPPEALDFLRALGEKLSPEERLITCAFIGDPGKAEPADWRPRPWCLLSKGWSIRTNMNAYVTVGAFGRSEDLSFRRRAALFRGGLAFMIDDVGTKVPVSVVEHFPPSARILTSPGNEQWWYIFREVERDLVKFDALIRAFIAGPLEGNDPGMASVTRVGRLPGYINGKPNYGGNFRTKLVDLNNRRFTIADLVKGFNLELIGERRPLKKILPKDAEDRIRLHFSIRRFLKEEGMLKRERADMAGWTEMRCPWVDEHTGAIDNGAAIREPHEENGFYGGFKCFHGACIGRNWNDLTSWVADAAAEKMNMINEDSDV